MIMLHGRGASAASILDLSKHLKVENFAFLAPEATQHTWYPRSFMAPVEENEPSLSSALEVLESMVQDIKSQGFQRKQIYFLGFSQGACLASEYVARHAQRYGGVFVLSGGLIGADLDKSKYPGDFQGTPFLLGCSNVDAHVPLTRVRESTQILRAMGAEVEERIYPNAPHSILEDEIEYIHEILSGS